MNYSGSDWTERIFEFTENKGIDIIAEMIGGEMVGENLKVLAVGGTMWVYGAASGEDYKFQC